MECVPVFGGLCRFPDARSTSDETMFKYRPRCAGYNKPRRRQQRSLLLAIWGAGLDPCSAAYYACILAASLVRHSASAPTAWGRTPGLDPVLQSSDRALVSLQACCQRRCVVCL